MKYDRAARQRRPLAEITMTMTPLMTMTIAFSRRSLRGPAGMLALTLLLPPVVATAQDAPAADPGPNASARPGFDPGPMLEQLSSALRAVQARTRDAQDRGADREADDRHRDEIEPHGRPPERVRAVP